MSFSLRLSAPSFWSNPAARLGPILLRPFTPITAFLTARTVRKRNRAPLDIPVLCVGNLSVGGTGKTPLALTLAKALQERGEYVQFITRGYKGRLKNSVQVDLEKHSYTDVGDEALLLARTAPCWVGTDRYQSAIRASKAGATCLVMDDGFQNKTLTPDFSLIVIDGQTGFGNGLLLPAGPLRESIRNGLKRAQGIVIIGQPSSTLSRILAAYTLPVWQAQRISNPPLETLRGKKILAFAGIGKPEQFFTTLRNIRPSWIHCRAFPDHYAYPRALLEKLLNEAQKKNAQLVTTAKDACRIPASLRPLFHIVDTTLTWDNPAAPAEISALFLNTRLKTTSQAV